MIHNIALYIGAGGCGLLFVGIIFQLEALIR